MSRRNRDERKLVGGLLGLALLAMGPASLAAQARTGDVVIGTQYVLKSASITGDIPVRIHLPAGYEDGRKSYPVLYMLEIAKDFEFAATAADFLASCGRIPGLIVVSVDVDKLAGPPPAMIAFLEKDLFPYVERAYRTQPRRILYGHSGRSFAALFILLNRPELVDDLICPGIGLSWPVEPGRFDFSTAMAGLLSKVTTFPKTLVLSLGDEEKFFAGVDHFVAVLREKAPKDFRWTYLQYPDDDHTSTKLKTLYQGLEFIFKPGPAGDPTGEWSGFAEIRTEEGSANRLVILADLRCEGTTVTGTLGPSADTRFAITKGERAAAEVVLEAAMPTRQYRMRLSFGWDGGLSGRIVSADGKVTGVLRLRRSEPQEAIEAVKKNDRAGLAALLEKNPGAVGSKDADGRTPLHWAARRAAADLDLARLLLDRGADVNVRDANGLTPLHEAASRALKDLTALLLAGGADVNAEDQTGRTPLICAAARFPLGFAVPPGRKDTVKLLAEAGAAFPETGEAAAKLLHTAAACGYRELAERMVRRGVDRRTINNDGGTLLHSAAAGGSAELVRELGPGGPDVDARDRYGLTPLHVAAIVGSRGAAEALLELRADAAARSPSGKTALHYASENGHKDLADLLAAGPGLDRMRFPVLEGPYLAQASPGPEPALFAPGIVSTPLMEHGPAVFSHDGREVFWTEAVGSEGRIMTMKMAGGRWTAPRRLQLAGLKNQEMPALSPDGRRLFFNAESPEGSRSYGLWYADRKGNDWGPPVNIKAIATGLENSQPSVTRDGTLYFSSGRDGGLGGFDLYRSRFVDGGYRSPENLGPVINSENLEIHPFVDADERTLIFTSDRPGGKGGYDLYISFRRTDGSWSGPVNMGDRVNGRGTINWLGALTPDGKYLFFASNRNGNSLDVWWVEASFIRGLRAAVALIRLVPDPRLESKFYR